jgi:hypothetical protein
VRRALVLAALALTTGSPAWFALVAIAVGMAWLVRGLRSGVSFIRL